MSLYSGSFELVQRITLTCAGVLKVRPGRPGWAWAESAFWGGAIDREEPYFEDYLCATEPILNHMRLDSICFKVVQSITLKCAGVLRSRPGRPGWAWAESAF